MTQDLKRVHRESFNHIFVSVAVIQVIVVLGYTVPLPISPPKQLSVKTISKNFKVSSRSQLY